MNQRIFHCFKKRFIQKKHQMENSDDIRHHYQYQGSCYILWVTIVIKSVCLQKIIDQIIVVS